MIALVKPDNLIANTILQGDALTVLRTLGSCTVQCCITSPPYYGLRDYGVDGQIGLEETPEQYIEKLVEVFREVKRVLRDDGTLWINCGDSYSGASSRRVTSCDTCDKERSSYPGRDFLYESLCDVCLSDLLSHKFHISRQHVPTPIVSLFDPNQEHQAIERDHLPTSDFLHQKQTRQFYDATQGQEQTISLFDEPLPSVQESSLDVFSQQLPGSHLQIANDAYYQSGVDSLTDYAQVSSHKLNHEPVETSDYIQGNASPYEVQQSHSLYTSGYCSRCASYSNTLLTNIQAHCTTCAKASQALGTKQLLMIPARLALALQSDGWYLRSDIIWHKPNVMPESVKDRPTKSHEHLFLLSKSANYYYDADAIREPHARPWGNGLAGGSMLRASRIDDLERGSGWVHRGSQLPQENPAGRNKRSVWTIATQPYSEAHFAVMPTALVEPCVLAGSRPGDIVLDPFSGAATVPLVAARNARSYIGIELNPAYVAMGKQRISKELGLWEVQP